MDFEIFNQFEFNGENIRKKRERNVIDTEKKWQLCEDCSVAGIQQEYSLICPDCGLELQSIDGNSENYKEDRKSTSITKIDGKNSYSWNKSLRTTCSNYPEWNKNKSIKKLNKFSYESKKDKTPEYINKRVVELFENIRKIKTFRGAGQNRILAAIVYYVLQDEGIARQPKSIAELHGISEKDLSKGDSIVRKYLEENVIELSVNNNNYENFVDKYLEMLDIDQVKYKQLILDIIEKSEQKRLYRKKTPKPSTKCVGAIYLVINSCPELKKRVTKDMIVKKCNISKTTFICNYNLLITNKSKFKHIYKKYNKRLNLKFPSE